MNILVRCETRDGMIKWATFPDHERATDHASLCKAFGLDVVRTSFDLPSTARGVGSASGRQDAGRRAVSGYILWPVKNATNENDREPIGTLHFVQEGEVIPDISHRNQSDFLNLHRRFK